jgi:hypothetical protein
MALWGISTTTETAANNYAIPKYKHSVDRNRTPWNTFADVRGWIYRRYGTSEHSGLSSSYYDEVLVPVAGLNTGTDSPGNGANNTGLGTATPVAVFFEDPNLSSIISVGGGGTSGIGTGRTGYVHVVWNENVYCSAGATIRILRSTGSALIGTASSIGTSVVNYTNSDGYVVDTFNGQISNRIAFAFPVPVALSGIGTVLSIDLATGVVGTITDFSGGGPVTKTLSSDLICNVGGAGTYLSVHRDTGLPVGIGTTTLTITA